MSAINIDDDINTDWLHSSPTHFEISQSGKTLGTADISGDGSIESDDEKLKEYFYLLIDEGIDDGGPITSKDEAAFVQALEKEGYSVRAL